LAESRFTRHANDEWYDHAPFSSCWLSFFTLLESNHPTPVFRSDHVHSDWRRSLPLWRRALLSDLSDLLTDPLWNPRFLDFPFARVCRNPRHPTTRSGGSPSFPTARNVANGRPISGINWPERQWCSVERSELFWTTVWFYASGRCGRGERFRCSDPKKK
jgi:hypothetical protein